jgi:D-alanyl-lipoteichoic acid acyltransferase DltB (MBOAT superfamily)
MSYNSLTFLILLLVCVGLYFCSVRSWQRQAILLAASIIFYLSAGGIKMILSVLISSAAVYILSQKIESIYEEYEQKKNKLVPKEQVKFFAEYKKRP